MLDLVDENDVVLDTLDRDEIYSKNLNYVRVVEVFIKNDHGEIWIPVRLDTKRIAPGGFDVGVGGHIEHGETPLEAFRKETSEELGWDIDKLSWREVGKFTPKEGLNTVSHIYEIQTNDTPVFGTEDFKSASWMTPQAVADAVKAGHPSKMNLPRLLEIVYRVS